MKKRHPVFPSDLLLIRQFVGGMTINDAGNIARRVANDEANDSCWAHDSDRVEWVNEREAQYLRLLHRFFHYGTAS